MTRIDVNCEIRTYPEDGEKDTQVNISSHWNEENKVVIKIGKREVTVIGDDLITAAQNCMNSG